VSHPIVGTWRLTSFTERDLTTGAVAYPMGEGAKAMVIYTADGYAATIFTAEGRSAATAAPASESEAAQLYRSMIAFAGRYELDGDRLTYRPEITWNEAWNGTTQVRFFVIDDDRLRVDSAPIASPSSGNQIVFSLAWERAK